MHPGFQIPESEHQHHHQVVAPDNSCTALLLSMNQTHNILEQIHGTLPTTTQPRFLDQPLLLPSHHHHHQTRLSHHMYGGGGGGGGPPSSFFPVNFKLGLTEICKSNKDGTNVSCFNNEGEDGLVRGSEQYEVPEARQFSHLGMHHCWQNQEDSAIKENHQHQPFREPEVSNENSDIVIDRQENTQMNHTKLEAPLTNCLDSKSRAVFGELEAIYKRLGTEECNQTGPIENFRPEINIDHGYSEASIGEELEASPSKKINDVKRKTRRKKRSYNEVINPMAEFFEGLLKQMMNHQENLQTKFAEVMERIDQERRKRDEAWRNHESARFEREAEARARDKASVASREATIVSYLERITGERIHFHGPMMEPETTTKEN